MRPEPTTNPPTHFHSLLGFVVKKITFAKPLSHCVVVSMFAVYYRMMAASTSSVIVTRGWHVRRRLCLRLSNSTALATGQSPLLLPLSSTFMWGRCLTIYTVLSYTSSPDSPVSLIPSLTLSNHLLSGLPCTSISIALLPASRVLLDLCITSPYHFHLHSRPSL